MSRRTSDLILSTALWRANRKRCFFCEEVVEFRDLEIDHLIPESISSRRLAELRPALGRGKVFEIQSPSNLVPTHHNCNSRKSDHVFSEGSVRYYLEIWQSKQAAVNVEIEELEKQAVICQNRIPNFAN